MQNLVHGLRLLRADIIVCDPAVDAQIRGLIFQWDADVVALAQVGRCSDVVTLRRCDSAPSTPVVPHDRSLFCQRMNRRARGLLKNYSGISRILLFLHFLIVECPVYPHRWVHALEDFRANSVERCRFHLPVDRKHR